MARAGGRYISNAVFGRTYNCSSTGAPSAVLWFCICWEKEMPERSAGVLIWRNGRAGIEVLLVHPGGPYWRNRNAGAWQIPKGGIQAGEDAATAARREAQEELGVPIAGDLVPLGELRQAGGKIVEAFALESDVDAAAISSNSFEMEWPPRSGRRMSFPEIDAARWFPIDRVGPMMLASQIPFLDRLLEVQA